MSTENRAGDESSSKQTTAKSFLKRAFGTDLSIKKQSSNSHTNGILTNVDQPLADDSTKYSVSPVSPEFDSITELPSPVASEYSHKSTKKSYGSLSIRPSANYPGVANNNRITSEYAPGSLNKVNDSSRNIDATLAPLKNKNVRTLSTPLEEQSNNLEREETLDILPDNAPQKVIYSGYDEDNILHQWRHVRPLGKGTFSNVVLGESMENGNPYSQFIAIKIVELPSRKDTRSRVESSLKRELELLRYLKHPSIIRLLALLITENKYFMFTPFCEGGDLFELASMHRSKLSPKIIRRMFAEIATAISYLHQNNVVHRDIKLENVLINHKLEDLLSMSKFEDPLITVTDFGLSRKIDPEDPLLTTRCGSEDYVPPELLIGMPYDGRQTDSWAMGVLLYAIMEGRLPFDPPPNKSIRARSRVAHRIARIEWTWNEFSEGNKDVKWTEEDWSGAKFIVENLLVRREKRISAADVCKHPWVRDCL